LQLLEDAVERGVIIRIFVVADTEERKYIEDKTRKLLSKEGSSNLLS